MSNNLSPSTRALLDAAKHDGPSREKRAAMWTGISGGVVTHTPPQLDPKVKPQGAGASGSTAPVTKGAFWAGASMKGAFIGALFGSAISIGVATFMLRAKSEPAAPAPVAQAVISSPNNANATQNAQPANGGTTIELPTTPPDSIANAQSAENSVRSSTSQNATESSGDTRHASLGSRSQTHTAGRAAKKDSASNESPDEMLAREAALVGDAHRELLTGDPTAALKSVRAARSLDARQMEPEEMNIEVKALRALGRDSEAERVEAQLRTLYPGR